MLHEKELDTEMGLGWMLGHYKDVRTVCHGGMGFGWTDFLLILPEKNFTAGNKNECFPS